MVLADADGVLLWARAIRGCSRRRVAPRFQPGACGARQRRHERGRDNARAGPRRADLLGRALQPAAARLDGRRGPDPRPGDRPDPRRARPLGLVPHGASAHACRWWPPSRMRSNATWPRAAAREDELSRALRRPARGSWTARAAPLVAADGHACSPRRRTDGSVRASPPDAASPAVEPGRRHRAIAEPVADGARSCGSVDGRHRAPRRGCDPGARRRSRPALRLAGRPLRADARQAEMLIVLALHGAGCRADRPRALPLRRDRDRR